ncbi:MAG: DNA-binding response regulator [Gallionellales bacterium RIFCSPLOWO2_12_FULL_59_22]|nr:MAG: DNA-binding response regulator [Gallionellales bacterium RIFCSPLOWO2_02_FULL_59_110]OGT01885.1 MAG: DNA-binding response regulator [Gallionellales bacterium RIFCSPLOWO2_02_58_13]OGT10655.1 MAG: DNA-binding response regulator [Gallionellales bacterium RIFCSPLOWO2_12_FULL_59_22]
MMDKKRILIVEDHALLRAGLKALLSGDTDIEIVGEAENGRDAVRLTGTLDPDLVLTDLSMAGMNGIESIVDIKRYYPDVRVLVLTIHKTDEYIFAAMRAGANGYILKDASHDELRIAIRSVLNGKTYLSPDISAKVINGYLDTDKSSGPNSAWDTLTHREREVLKLVAEGNTNKFIADYFCLSVKTVEKHRSNLMKKLDLHNASMMTAYAIERGLVSN